MTEQIVSDLEAERGALAEALGEDAAQISIARPAWLRSLGRGVVVTLHIGHWPALQQMTASDLAAQLGVSVTPEELAHWRQFLMLGANRLLPVEYTREADTRATAIRTALEQFSYKAPWGWFVPLATYQLWKAKHRSATEDYFRFRDRLVAEYNALRAQVLESYTAQADVVYARLCQLGAQPEVSRPEFVDSFVNKIASKIKTVDAVRASFYVRTELSYVPLLMQQTPEQAAQQQTDMTRWATARLDQQALAERQRQLAEMNADILASFQQQREEQLSGFLRDVVAQMRGHVFEVVVGAIETMRRNNGRLLTRSADALRNFITATERMNFYEDEELVAKLAELRGLLGSEERSPEQIEQSLRELGTMCRYTLAALGEAPRAARGGGDLSERAEAIGIPTQPSLRTVRKLRGALGLDAKTEPLQALGLRRTRRALS